MEALDLLTKNLRDQAVPLDACEFFKFTGNNNKLEMAFPGPVISTMTPVEMAFVDNFQFFGLKGRPQKFSHYLFQTHTTSPLLKTVLTLYNGSMPRIKLKQNSPEFADGKPADRPKSCEMPGCGATGDHRAPRDRSLSGYYWFCLDHVREYNQAWDFFSGMNETEIENHIHNSFYGDRPTWRYGLDSKDPAEILRHKAWQTYNYTDKEAEKESAKDGNSNGAPPSPEREALGIMGLQEPVTFEEIKSRYKTLAKKHHPDRNGGSQESEELLKRVNMAYTILKLAYQKYQRNMDQSG